MVRFVFQKIVVGLLWVVTATASAQPPIVPTPGYRHDRFVTQPRDHIREFQAYIASFDTNDDDDGDGAGDSRGVPEFVAYELRQGDSDGPASKPNKWRPVPDLSATTASPTDDSYKGSDYSRGHMCMRDHAHRLGSDANYHTFNVINACPQIQAFNGGHWLGLEKLTGDWADVFGTVWIICGPVFEDFTPDEWIGDSGEVPVGVPEGFFKIVIRESNEADRPHVLAFYYDHDPDLNSSSQGVDHTEFLVSVRSIQARTGLDFFTSLPDDVEEAIEAEPAAELWDLEPDIPRSPIPPAVAVAPRSVMPIPGAAVVPAPPAAAVAAAPDYVNGTASFVPDGDTVHLGQGGTVYKVRLHAVDCPESDQSFGPQAREFTQGFVEGKEITVRVVDRDRYGRLVGEVFVEGRSLNRELARSGLAWWYDRYAAGDLDIGRLVHSARSAGAGLWGEASPIPPWDWRASQ